MKRHLVNRIVDDLLQQLPRFPMALAVGQERMVMLDSASARSQSNYHLNSNDQRICTHL